MNWLDWLLIAAYMTLLVWVALRQQSKVHQQDDVFLAGRSMSRWPVAISMYMALFSTNTLLGVTGWVNRPNGTIWIGLQVVGIVLAAPVVIWIFPSLFMRLRITTAYEYLQLRFNRQVRSIGTLFFLGARVMWMATMAYSASLVTVRMFGWSDAQQVWMIALFGLMGTLFAFAGGMYSVIWTDVIQFLVFMVALLLMFVMGVYLSGGVGSILETALEFHKFAPPPVFDPSVELTLVSGLLLGFVGMLASSGADQLILQTYLTAKSEEEAKAALWRNAIYLKPISMIFPLLGLIMFAYFQKHPETAALMRSSDDALPVFASNVLPAGLRGLMVMAVVSAVVSSLTSGLAAVSAALQTHAVQCWYKRSLSDTQSVRMARLLIVLTGIMITLGGFFVKVLGESNNVIQILNIVMYPFSGVLLGIFLLGVLTHRTNGKGALVGAIVGFLATICVPLSKLLLPPDGSVPESEWIALFRELGKVSTFYFGFLGTIMTIVFGYIASLLFAPPEEHQWKGLTRWSLPEGTSD
jgi:SSS family transporter